MNFSDRLKLQYNPQYMQYSSDCVDQYEQELTPTIQCQAVASYSTQQSIQENHQGYQDSCSSDPYSQSDKKYPKMRVLNSIEELLEESKTQDSLSQFGKKSLEKDFDSDLEFSELSKLIEGARNSHEPKEQCSEFEKQCFKFEEQFSRY